jgi:hypothetical protein
MTVLIKTAHILYGFLLLVSPFIDDCQYKVFSLIFISFMTLHFITKYGKCGLINIEMLLLKDKYREGILFNTIRPVISYKHNIFYKKMFWLFFVYIAILIYQIKNKCFK